MGQSAPIGARRPPNNIGYLHIRRPRCHMANYFIKTTRKHDNTFSFERLESSA